MIIKNLKSKTLQDKQKRKGLLIPYLKGKQALFSYNMYVKKVYFYIVFLFFIIGVGI